MTRREDERRVQMWHHAAYDCEVPVRDGVPGSVAGRRSATSPTSTKAVISAPPIVLTAVGTPVDWPLSGFRFGESGTGFSNPTVIGAIGMAIKPKGSWTLKDFCRSYPIGILRWRGYRDGSRTAFKSPQISVRIWSR